MGKTVVSQQRSTGFNLQVGRSGTFFCVDARTQIYY